MSDLVAVLPILDARWGYECLSTITAEKSALGLTETERGLGSLLVVDNTQRGFTREQVPLGADGCTCYVEAVYEHDERCPLYHHSFPEGPDLYRDSDGHNLGVARSWNVGVREMYDRDADYVLLISASMRFGPILHTTFVRQMRTFWGADVIECDGHSWHLIAIHRRCFDEVGLFDENFYPAYEESIDWCYRLRLVGREGGWPHVWVNAMSAGAAWHTRMVSCPNEPLRTYYRSKWGGDKGQETWTHPFNGDQSRQHPLSYFPEVPIPELAERYGLETWW